MNMPHTMKHASHAQTTTTYMVFFESGNGSFTHITLHQTTDSLHLRGISGIV